MPKNNESKFSDYFQLPNPGLRSYFGRVRSGSSDDIRTPFGEEYYGIPKEDLPRELILNDWAPILESLSDKWPSLVQFENDQRDKVGPMSVQAPLSERFGDIDHYYDDILLPSLPITDRALKAVLSEFSAIRGIEVREQSRTVEKMKKSTNSGSPFFTKKRLVTGKTFPCRLFERNYHVLQKLKGDSFWEACAVLGWRGQEGGPTDEDTKQRVVWMFPYAVNICELQVYQPLIEQCQYFNFVPAWVSMDAVDARITRMFNYKDADDYVVCTDFSKFDQHFNSDMANGAKTILSGLLSENLKSADWLSDVFPIKYVIPLAYDYGKIRFGRHGMGSGSGGTNADETLAHRALQYEAAQEDHQMLNPFSQCLGDDGVLTFRNIDVDNVIRSYTRHGLEMNADKQYVSKQDCVYLKRWHHIKYKMHGTCVGVYSTYRALGRLMAQERFYDDETWSKEMVALRQLSILENCKFHPLREKFVEFCMRRDRYRLGVDIPGFLDHIDRWADKATEDMPEFLGYTKSLQVQDNNWGVSSWWIVRYLQSKKGKA